MRSAIRANCGSDVTKLQHATKAPLLHMFDIHTNCEESFCSVRRRRLETVRMYLIFKSLYDSNHTYLLPQTCLSTEITIPEKIQTMLCELILDLQNVSFVNDIRSRLDHPDVKVLISELNDHLSFPKYSTISFSEERILFAILTNQLNDLNKKDSMKMKISSSFRQNCDPKQFQSVSPKKVKSRMILTLVRQKVHKKRIKLICRIHFIIQISKQMTPHINLICTPKWDFWEYLGILSISGRQFWVIKKVKKWFKK